MGRAPLPRSWDLRRLPTCEQCGGKVRQPREVKECPDCHRTLPRAAFGHNRARRDHLGATCLECRRATAQRNRRRSGSLGKPIPIGKVAPVQSGWLIGTFAGQDTWPGYVQADGSPVWRMTLKDAWDADGFAYTRLSVPHVYDLSEAPLHPGQRIILVVEQGEVMKAVLIDDAERTIWTLVDEALFGYLDESKPLPDGPFPFQPVVRSWSPARRWMTGLVLKALTGSEEPGACVFGCEATAIITEDGGYACPRCMDGREMSADVLLVERGEARTEDVYELLSDLETEWLLDMAAT